MFRGTNPIITINLSCDPTLITKLKLTFKQGTDIVLEKVLADCTIEDNKLKVQLTEEDTLAFKSCVLQMQARIQLSTGDILVTNVLETYVDNILNDASLDAEPIVPGKDSEEGYKIKFLNEKAINIGDNFARTQYRYFKIDIQKLQNILRKKFKNLDEIPTSILRSGTFVENGSEHGIPLLAYTDSDRRCRFIGIFRCYCESEGRENSFTVTCENFNSQYQTLNTVFNIPNFDNFASSIKFIIIPFAKMDFDNFYNTDMTIMSIRDCCENDSDNVVLNNFDSISDIEDDLRSCITIFEGIE